MIHSPVMWAEVDDMRRVPAAMALVAAWVLTGGYWAPGEPPAREVPAARTDLYGDPLPPGSRARMGSLRYYMGRGTSTVAFAPDGRTLTATSGSWIVPLRL